MKDADGKKITILSSKDVAAQAMLKATLATLADLRPIQETLLNVGTGLHGIAALLEDYEKRITAVETLLADIKSVLMPDAPVSPEEQE